MFNGHVDQHIEPEDDGEGDHEHVLVPGVPDERKGQGDHRGRAGHHQSGSEPGDGPTDESAANQTGQPGDRHE